MIWQTSIAAGDLAWTLQKENIKNGDVVVVKLMMNPDEPWINQKYVDDMATTFAKALKEINPDGEVIVLPLPNGSTADVYILNEPQKELLRTEMRRLGVIE